MGVYWKAERSVGRSRGLGARLCVCGMGEVCVWVKLGLCRHGYGGVVRLGRVGCVKGV